MRETSGTSAILGMSALTHTLISSSIVGPLGICRKKLPQNQKRTHQLLLRLIAENTQDRWKKNKACRFKVIV